MPETSDTAYPAEITGGGIVLALTSDELYFETVEALPEKDLTELIEHHHLELTSEPPGLFGASFNQKFPDRRWVRITDGSAPQDVVAVLQANARVHLASPVYHRPDLPYKTALSFSDLVLAKVRGTASRRTIAELADRTGAGELAVDLEIAQADGTLMRLRLPAPKERNALQIASAIAAAPEVTDVHPDWMQLTSASSATPDDPHFPQQWDMTQIAAPQGWSVSEGSASVVIAIVDSGCDLGHEDLSARYVPVAQRRDVVAGTNTPEDDFGHGTCCASIAAASTNNALGVAGVGWNCRIMPIKLYANDMINSEADIVSAINWATVHGASVISMSWRWFGTTSNAEVAFASAAAANLLMVAASGNDNSGTITYPGISPHCMAIGASDKNDQRKNPASPDGEQWGSNYGPQQSVMAPGIQCWAANNTDGQATFNNNNGGPINIVGVNYPSSGTTDEKYFALMNGTSAATPHVAGLAGLLLSQYPALTNTQVRAIIEQTAEKTGGYSYVSDGVHNNGTWNSAPGYGRINVFRALDYADVFIKAFPADTGSRPFAGAFWDSSDIAVRSSDDGIFAYEPPQPGQDNYVYVRVNNAGPNTARNVSVSARVAAFLGTQFSYPGDFAAVDALHLEPAGLLTSFGDLPPGTTAIAKFKLTAAQVNLIYTDGHDSCVIADVSADNDYGSGDGENVWDNNNLGQRNLGVLTLAPGGAGMSAMGYLPFVTGSRFDQDRFYDLVIDRSALPSGAELLLNPQPSSKLFSPALGQATTHQKQFTTTFLDQTRITVRVCECDAILTLAAGSQFSCAGDLACEFSVSGGTVIVTGGVQLVEIQASVAVIGIAKAAGELRPMDLSVRLPAATPAGSYQVVVSQRNTGGQTVGGVTFDVSVS
jgi:subtilisin family serine protease